MSGTVQERYQGLLMGVNAVVATPANSIGGFLCKTSGTITIVRGFSNPVTVVDTFPITAGVYYPMPFELGSRGGTVTLAGGASGTLGYS